MTLKMKGKPSKIDSRRVSQQNSIFWNFYRPDLQTIFHSQWLLRRTLMSGYHQPTGLPASYPPSIGASTMIITSLWNMELA